MSGREFAVLFFRAYGWLIILLTLVVLFGG